MYLVHNNSPYMTYLRTIVCTPLYKNEALIVGSTVITVIKRCGGRSKVVINRAQVRFETD